MMLGVVRRSVSSRGSSASILKLTRFSTSAPSTCSMPGKEVLLHPKGPGHVRNFCRLILPGKFLSAFIPRLPCKCRAGHSVDAVVPYMGESISDGTLAKFLKNPGDSVHIDEPIAQFETDKVIIDVISPEAGVVQKFVAKVGDVLEPGNKVAVISKSGEGVTEVASSEKKSSEGAPKPPSEGTMQTQSQHFSSDNGGDSVDAVVPYMGESISDGTLGKFLKIMGSDPGDSVHIDEPIAQIETDKVTIDVTSPGTGVIQEFVAKEGAVVEPGAKIAVISKSAEVATPVTSSEKKSDKAAPKPPPATETKNEKPKSKAETAPVMGHPKVASLTPPKHASEPMLSPKERERHVPMTRLRKRVATRLKDSQNTFALLTTFNEVDMTNLMKLRSDYKDAFSEKHGVKLGFMSGFVKNQPVINAVIDGDDIIYRDYMDVGIAVGTPKGLVVPVIRDADKMNFAEIEKEINTLAKKANDGTLSIDEMSGGSFTISNGGVYGSLLSTPIINPPQSAILGMHSIVNRPMVVGGIIIARPMMYIALTYDHRLIDGREAVFFLRRIKEVVEDPRRLLLDI